MPNEFDVHYDIVDLLSREETNLPAPVLFNQDPQRYYVDAMDRLSRPLPNGLPSAFTGRNPLSAEGQLLSVFFYYFSAIGHEANLMPDFNWYMFFRMLGIVRRGAEPALIPITFTASRNAFESIPVIYIPPATQVQSQFNSIYSVFTLDEVELTVNNRTATVAARLNIPGVIPPTIRENEFVLLTPSLSLAVTSTNTFPVIYEGLDEESVEEMMNRARRKLQSPGERLVTLRDYVNIALDEGGATKAIAVPNLRQLDNGDRRDYLDGLVSVIVYPSLVVNSVAQLVAERSQEGSRIDVKSARIIPITGEIDINITPALTEAEARNLAAQAIVDQINPPNGKWGDRSFQLSLVTVLEKIEGFYAIPRIELQHAVTEVKLSDLEIFPWDLFEIQDDIRFSWQKI